MSRTKKIISVIVLLTIVTLGVGTALLWFFIPSEDFVKKNIETAIASATNTQVSIGDISIGFSPSGPIKVFSSDVRIFGLNGEQTLFIKSIQMTPSLLGLLRGSISISSIHLDGVGARVFIQPDGLIEYPFFPTPASSDSSETTARIKDAANTIGATGQMTKPDVTGPREANVAWSIDSVRANDVTVGVTDLRNASSQYSDLSLAVSEIEMRQTSGKSEFNLVMNGVNLTSKPDSTIKMAATGSVKLNSSLDSLETCQLNLKLESANLSAAAAFAPAYSRMLQPLSVRDAILKLNYEASSGVVAEMTGPLFHVAVKSSPVMIKARIESSKDFSSLSRLEVNAESSGAPLTVFSSLHENQSVDLSKGVFSGSVSFDGNPSGEWSGKMNLKLEGADLIGKGRLALDGAVLSLVARGTPRVILLQEMSLKDQRGLFRCSGEISNPFQNFGDMAIRLDTELQTTGDMVSSLAGTDELAIKGPLSVTGRLKGPLSRVGFDFQADLTQASVEAVRRIAKQAGARGAVGAKGVASNIYGNKGKSPTVEGTLGFEFSKNSVNSLESKPLIRDLDISGKSTFDYSQKGLDLKDLEVEIRRHANKTLLAKLRGNVDGLFKGAMKINASVNSNLDNDLINALGMADPKGLRFLGQTTLGLKIAQNGDSYSFALDSPLKGLEISYGDFFLKKQGIEGLLTLNGNHSTKLTRLNAASLTLPGLSLGASGKLADPKGDLTEIDLLIKEVDLKKFSSLFPDSSSNNISGKCSGKILIKSERNALLPYGAIKLDSIFYKPQKSMIHFEQVNGSVTVNGINLDKVTLDGRARGFVDAPISATANIQNIHSVDNLKGNVSIKIGAGAIKFQNFRGVFSKPQSVLGTLGALGVALLNNQNLATPEFESITGDFSIEKGVAHTENLRQIGGDLRSGIIGEMDLRTRNLNAMMAAKALVYPPEQLGKIPAVKELAKKHEGLLKSFGLDKELKKIGIDTDDQKTGGQESGKPQKTSIFLILKLTGNAGEPSVAPVLEKSIQEALALKLKALVD